MQRSSIHEITFRARCKSGLHIGGSQDELKIGGSDNPVIKNPGTGKPYIPGSSLKGKMRAELEKELGKFGSEGAPCGCATEECALCRVFGAHTDKSELGPSRIIVRDGRLISDFHLENKMENTVNRGSGAARNPRSNERVAEGAEFAMQIILQVLKNDADFEYGSSRGGEALQKVIARALKLVELTGLGGGTSRGSGAISFHDFQMDGKPWQHWSG